MLVIHCAVFTAVLSACAAPALATRPMVVASGPMQTSIHRGEFPPLEPCFVGTRNCSSANLPPPGPCLASTAHCVTQGVGVIDALGR